MSHPRDLFLRAPLLLVLSLGVAMAAPPPTPDSPGERPTEAPAPPPSLDDLLGITPEKPSPPDRPAAIDPGRAELDRKLTPSEASDQFKQAVELMGQTAERLQASRDTGLATQRLQEDIIRKLDMVIHSSQQQQQQSSSKSSQRGQQQNQQSQPQQGQAQQTSSSPAKEAAQPPARRDGPLNPDLPARGAAWGALPERVRDSLLQGNADKYSSLYQRWTEAYYRRLAEEGNR